MAELTIESREGLAVASIMARTRVPADAIGAALSMAAPDRPGWAAGSDLILIGNGPGTWLVMSEAASGEWIDGLRMRLNGLASISDQSGGHIVLRLTGADARKLLQRGVAIDLHPAGFGPGSAAITAIASIAVVLWQIDATPTYGLAAPRSYGAFMRRWIDTVADALTAEASRR